jgi:RNA polymerase sigma-70 factor (ECF subfamily)
VEAVSLTTGERAADRDPLGQLAQDAAAGDLPAMRRLLDAVAPRVVRTVRKVLGPGAPDVEDVGQESLIALVRALPAFRGDSKAETYAARIAVRTAVAARHRHVRRIQKRRELALEPQATSSQPLAGSRLRLQLLREMLAELPAGQGETLALRVVLGSSIKEIAEATQVPVNTVRSRLRLAKEALRKRIEEDPTLAAELEVEP